MDVLENPPEPPRSGRSTLLIVLVALAVVLAAGVGLWLTLRRPAPPPTTVEVVKPVPTPAAPPAPKETPTPEPERPARPRTPRKPAPPPPEPTPAAPEAPSLALHVDSDVPGASVFVDRQYVGTTPVTTSEVTAGSHTLNVSAEGYEGYAGTVQITEGTKDVMVRFKEVRLNASVAVVHKHTVGSCSGRLVADITGIRYETSNKDDAFKVPFAQLETFEIEYLKKNLKVKLRKGKTFNFTEPGGNADALFIFHRDVQAARDRLAKGDKPAAVK